MVNEERPQVGMEVVDNSDRLLGTVEHIEPEHFVVQQGFFFPKSHRIQLDAIAAIRGNEVTLRITREEALRAGENTKWSDQPQHGEIAPDAGDID